MGLCREIADLTGPFHVLFLSLTSFGTFYKDLFYYAFFIQIFFITDFLYSTFVYKNFFYTNYWQKIGGNLNYNKYLLA